MLGERKFWRFDQNCWRHSVGHTLSRLHRLGDMGFIFYHHDLGQASNSNCRWSVHRFVCHHCPSSTSQSECPHIIFIVQVVYFIDRSFPERHALRYEILHGNNSPTIRHPHWGNPSWALGVGRERANVCSSTTMVYAGFRNDLFTPCTL